MKRFIATTAAVLSFAAPAQALTPFEQVLDTCVESYGNTSCAALIQSAMACIYVTNAKFQHLSYEQKVQTAAQRTRVIWDKAGVNVDRLNKKHLTRLSIEMADDYCEFSTYGSSGRI